MKGGEEERRSGGEEEWSQAFINPRIPPELPDLYGRAGVDGEGVVEDCNVAVCPYISWHKLPFFLIPSIVDCDLTVTIL